MDLNCKFNGIVFFSKFLLCNSPWGFSSQWKKVNKKKGKREKKVNKANT